MLSLYIHVPFCKTRCHYCSFYSTAFGKAERDAFLHALCMELAARAQDYGNSKGERPPLDTIYFGGGTPSQLTPVQFQTIFAAIRENFHIREDAEITIECNPDDLVSADRMTLEGEELLSTFKDEGVNRISLGIQAFDDAILHTINRRHTATQALDAIRRIHQTGIHNVSIDLIYGLPGQTVEDFRRDLATVVKLLQPQRWSEAEDSVIGPAITHLSSYALSIEEGTPLYNMRARGEIRDTDDDTLHNMYSLLCTTLADAGMEHYEISNFALPHHHSRHNSRYWRQTPYIGLGPGAHSYNGKRTRQWNLPDLHSYLAHPTTSFDTEQLSDAELYDELILTRLRTREGLPLELLTNEQRRHLLRCAHPYLSSNRLTLTSTHLRLSEAGIFISDTIFSDLMWEE